MAIWSRKWKEKRTYFNEDAALTKRQDSRLTIKLFGITLIERIIYFDADVIDGKSSVGFNTK